MATELGQAYVQIMPSAKGISGAIQKELDPEAAKAGESAGSKIGAGIKLAGAAAVAAAGLALGKIITSSITEGANLQQSLGGVETLFKGSADKLKGYANEAYKTAGLSANDYMETTIQFSASLLQSLGGDTETAAEKANMAITDMADNSNKMGTSMQSIQDAYRGFSRENYTMLDNLSLGYGGTKTEMERLLADATKLSGVKYDISNLSDVYDAIHVVQQELGITGTTALESAETFSGSLASMKAAFSNFLGNLSLGNDVAPSLNALAETVSTFLFGNFLPMVGNILKTLPGAIVTFIKAAAPYFLEAGGQFAGNLATGIATGLPNLLASAANIITSIIGGIAEKLPTVLEKGKEIITNIASGIISNLPAIGESAISAVSSFIGTIINNLPTIAKAGIDFIAFLVSGILSNLPQLIATAVTLISQFVTMLVSKLPDLIKVGVEIVASIISGIGQVAASLYEKGAELMRGLLSKIKEGWNAVTEWFTQAVESAKTFGTNLVEGIKSGIGNIWNKISENFSAFTTAIGTFFSGIWETIKGYGTTLVAKFKEGFGDIWGKIQDKFNSLKSGLSSFFSALWGVIVGYGTSLINKLKEGIGDIWGKVSSAYKSFKTSLGTFFSELIITAKKWGADIIAGIENGISNKLSGLVEKAKGIVSAVKEGIKGFIFGSPSKLMEQYGGWVAEGMAQGIEKKTPEVKTKAEKMADAIIGAMEQVRTSISTVTELAEAKYNLLIAKMGNTGTEADKLKAKEELLTDQFIAQKEKVMLTEQAYNDMVKSTGATSQASVQLETQLYREQTALIAIGTELGNVNKELQNMGKNSDSAITALNNAALAMDRTKMKALEAAAALEKIWNETGTITSNDLDKISKGNSYEERNGETREQTEKRLDSEHYDIAKKHAEKAIKAGKTSDYGINLTNYDLWGYDDYLEYYKARNSYLSAQYGHTGGVIKRLGIDPLPELKSGEVPIIAKEGEWIGWPGQLASIFGGKKVFNNSGTASEAVTFTGPVNVTIPAGDLKEMQDIKDFFSRITQTARAQGVY